MLIRPLYEVAFDTEMRQDGECALRVPEGVRRNCYSWVIVELSLQEVESEFEVFDNIVVVSASFIVLHEPSA